MHFRKTKILNPLSILYQNPQQFNTCLDTSTTDNPAPQLMTIIQCFKFLSDAAATV